jgi:hypothetical protein
VPSQNSIAEAPTLVGRHLILHYLHIAIALLRHTQYHVQDVQRIQHNLKVLIREELQKEIDQGLRLAHHVLWVSLNPICYIMQDLIDCLRPNSPIVLGVHHSLNLIRGQQLSFIC